MDSTVLDNLNKLALEYPDLYVVGGALRNRSLGEPMSDFDFTTRNAAQPARVFSKILNGVLVALDETPGRETFRTIGANGITFDFSELQGGSIEKDLDCRDFTFNAMAQRLKDFLTFKQNILDPHNGISDLNTKIIRALPGPVLENDPLRVLRAFRFAASFGFKIESTTLSRIQKVAPALSKISGERIHQECELFWQSRNTALLAQQMDQVGIWNHIVPHRKDLQKIISADGKTSLLQQSILVYSLLENFLNSPTDFFPKRFIGIESYINKKQAVLLKASALLYPIQQEKNGEIRLENALEKLKFSKADSSFIRQVVKSRNLAIETGLKFAGWSMDFSAIYEFVSENDNNLISTLFLIAASSKTKEVAEGPFSLCTQNLADFYLNRYRPAKEKPPFINGNDLIEQFNMKPSSLFKVILSHIEEGRILGSIKTKREAENMVRILIKNL